MALASQKIANAVNNGNFISGKKANWTNPIKNILLPGIGQKIPDVFGMEGPKKAPSPVTPTPEYAGDVGIVGGVDAFGDDRPGERRLYNAMIAPISKASAFNLGMANDIYGRQNDFGYDSNYMSQILPQLQQMFGMDGNTRNQYLSTYAQAMAPQRQQQQAQLGNTMAAMGMGGGRGARSLAQQQRGFAQDDLNTALQLLNADIAGRQQAGQSAVGMAGQRRSADTATMQQALQAFTGLGSEAAKLPVYAMEAFKPAAS